MEKTVIEKFEELTAYEKIEVILTSKFIERDEIKIMGGLHSPIANGPDGKTADGKQDIEVKSQINTNLPNAKLIKGGLKYGAASERIYQAKYKSNEITIVVGYNSKGILLYRFFFLFRAIAKEYKRRLGTNRKSSNIDFAFKSYCNHKSFKVLYVAHRNILKENKKIIQPNFYDFLLDQEKIKFNNA